MRLGSIAAFLIGATSWVSAVQDSQWYQSPKSFGGVKNGYYYNVWANYDHFTYKSDCPGSYELSWKDGGNVVAGWGYPNAGDKPITYSGTFSSTGSGYLSAYGWVETPVLLEVYIVEAWGPLFTPSKQGTHVGTQKVDGDEYNYLTNERVHAASVIGNNRNFRQLWAVRVNQRVGGVINVPAHLNFWKKQGYKVDKLDWMNVATEGVSGEGHSSIAVE